MYMSSTSDHTCDIYLSNTVNTHTHTHTHTHKLACLAAGGPQLFGDFSLSLFTFFQLSTGDSWSGVTRDMMVRDHILYDGKRTHSI